MRYLFLEAAVVDDAVVGVGVDAVVCIVVDVVVGVVVDVVVDAVVCVVDVFDAVVCVVVGVVDFYPQWKKKVLKRHFFFDSLFSTWTFYSCSSKRFRNVIQIKSILIEQ